MTRNTLTQTNAIARGSAARLKVWCFLFLLTFLAPGLYAQYMKRDSSSIIAQKDLIDLMIKTTGWKKKEKTRETKKVNFSFIPVTTSAGGNGAVVVTSVNAAFYMGNDSTTNLSNVYIIPYTNLSSRSGLILRPNLWLSENKWNIPGELRIAANNLNTYGMRSNSTNKEESIVSFQHERFYGTLHRLLIRYLYIGMGYNLDYFYNMSEELKQDSESDFHTYSVGTTGNTTSSGITFNILRDDRKNSINATNGFYNTFIYKINAPSIGSTYSWSSVYSDNRKYISFREDRHNVLGIWLIYWGTFGDVPYFNLPGTAQDLYGRTGRGYYYGRFRGKQMLYAECEYRFDISANGFFGGVIFANAQTFTQPFSNRFEYVRPAAGMGLRVKFNKHSDMNMTFDVAFGKDSFNWYINLGEFF
jgi:outer membrane protein assembly factor BamA